MHNTTQDRPNICRSTQHYNHNRRAYLWLYHFYKRTILCCYGIILTFLFCLGRPRGARCLCQKVVSWDIWLTDFRQIIRHGCYSTIVRYWKKLTFIDNVLQSLILPIQTQKNFTVGVLVKWNCNPVPYNDCYNTDHLTMWCIFCGNRKLRERSQGIQRFLCILCKK